MMKRVITKFIGFYLNVLARFAPKKAARIGFALFCHPLRGKLQPFHLVFFNSAEKIDLIQNNEKVLAYKWGNGETSVLFLHGWQSHSFRWRNYIKALDKKRFTVYALDAPAHGLSEGEGMTVPSYSDAVVLLLNQIGKCDMVVGHSVGSFTALYTFHHNPTLAPKRMIALAPPGNATEFINVFRRTLGVSNQCMKLIIDEFVRRVNREPAYFSSEVFAKSMVFPGLIIHDDMDEETSVSNSIDIHRAWIGSKLKITHGYGHNLKSPDIVKTVIAYIEKENVIESTLNGKSI